MSAARRLRFVARRTLWALLCALGTTLATAGPPPSAPDRLAWSVLEDPSGRLDADAVRARDASFVAATGRTLNPGFSRSAWWGRLTIAPTGAAGTRWLVMRLARLEQVQSWVAAPDGWRHLVAGTSVPHDRWPLDTPTATFPIDLPADVGTTIYLRVAGRNALSFDAELCTPADCQRTQNELLALDAALAGCLAFEIAGCLLLAVMQRHPGPLLVAAYALLYGLYESAYQGHAFQYLWPDATDGASRAMNPLAAGGIAALELSLCALSPPSNGMRRVLLVTASLLFPAAAAAWFGDYWSTALPVVFLCFATMTVGAVLGVSLWRQGVPQGSYVAVVGVMTLLGALPRYGYLAGVIPHSGWTVYPLPVVSLANGLVLIAAVLARMRTSEAARRASQAALLRHQASQAERSRLVAYLGHDLRAPLAVTIGHLRRLGHGLGGAGHALRVQAERAVTHQLELIDELVGYARGDAQEPELLPAAHFLYSLLDEVAGQGAMLAQENGNRFDATIAPTLPPVVRVDAKQFRRLHLNLLSNAAKFTHDGQLRWDVALGPGGADGRPCLRCVVSDTGAGIDEADLPHVFEPFWRAARNRATSPGTGLGLAIARRLVEAMGGRIVAASTPGLGSRFTVELPLDVAAPADVEWPALAARAPAPFGRGRTALVVDADPASREHVAELLFAAEFDVLHAPDTHTARALLKSGEVHLLITEQDLPDGSGWRLLDGDGAARSDPPFTVLYAARPPAPPVDLADGRRIPAHAVKPLDGEAWWALLASHFDAAPPSPAAAS